MKSAARNPRTGQFLDAQAGERRMKTYLKQSRPEFTSLLAKAGAFTVAAKGALTGRVVESKPKLAPTGKQGTWVEIKHDGKRVAGKR